MKMAKEMDIDMEFRRFRYQMVRRLIQYLYDVRLCPLSAISEVSISSQSDIRGVLIAIIASFSYKAP
jgi:hypothetical protein